MREVLVTLAVITILLFSGICGLPHGESCKFRNCRKDVFDF